MVNEKANVKVTLNSQEAQQQLEELQGEMKRLIALKKKAGEKGDIEGYKQIDKELKKVNRSANKLVREHENIEKTLKNINGASLKDLQSAKRSLQTRLNSLTRGTKEWKAELQNFNKVNSEIKKVRSSMGQLQSPMQRIKTSVKGIIASFGAFTGITALVSIVRNAARVSSEFSKSQSNLAAVLGTTKNNIRDLSQDAIKYGSLTQFTATQVSELQTEFAKLGLTTEQIKSSTKAALDLAAATNSELAPAAKVTGVALKAFNLSAANAESVAATLAVATTKSALSFEDFETILSTVGSVANTFGFKLEDVLALTGKLKDAGFDASTAATSTRNILLNLADANGKLAQTLGEPVKTLDDLVPALVNLKARGIDLNETLQLTDKRSVAAFNTFLTAADSTIELRDGISDVNEELKEMVDTQLDNLTGDITKLNSAWQGFILSIENGDGTISKFVRGTIQFFTDSLIKLSNVDLVFKRAGKFTEQELERVYDAMMNLSGRKYQAFQELVAKENKLTLEQAIMRRHAFIEEIRETGQSQKEAEMLWDEFYRRRYEQDKQARELKREEEQKAAEKVEQDKLLAEQKTAEKLKAKREAELKLDEFLAQDSEKQKAAIKKYFTELGEGAWEDFLEAIEKSQKEKTVDFSMIPENEEKEAEISPEANYELQQYQQTLDYKKILLEAQYQHGIIAEKEYQNKLNELNKQGEEKRYSQKMENIEKANQLANLGANFVFSLMELELEKAGDNEQRKAQIRKKYANLQFAVSASQIIVDTAAAVMKAWAQLGPIGGPIASAIIGATGLVQLGIANAERRKMKGYAEGKYPKLETGMYGNKPHLGVFNEVPGQPEMVVDGITTRNLQLNYPQVIKTIYDVRDGRTPQQYADGKYPASVPGISISAETVQQFDAAVERLTQWEPKLIYELIAKGLEQYNEIQNNR